MPENKPKGWHSRGYLPHFDGGEVCQFITLHLDDALPQMVLKKLRSELERENDEDVEIKLRERIEEALDIGYGKCYLRKPEIAKLTQDALLFFEAVKYKLLAWVIMPNHAHFLLKPVAEYSLSEIIHSIKSYTAQKANKILHHKGKFWQEDYFDRFIRNYDHFETTIAYIENNPVKAGLCKKATDWEFSSARRYSKNI